MVCPSCERLLRIPTSEDEIPPLVVRAERSKEAVAEQGEMVKKRRRRKKKAVDLTESWEKEPSARRHSRRGERVDRIRIVGFLIGGFILLAGFLMALFLLDKGSDARAEKNKATAKPAPIELPKSVEKTDADFLEKAEPVVTAFLQAKSVEDLLPVVRNAAAAEPRMRDYYATHEFAPVGINTFNVVREVVRNGASLSVVVRTSDYDLKDVVCYYEGDKVKVDWENAVGWSEMPWSEFKDKKPGKPTLFRADVATVEYYNYDFSDDDKWHSYRLSSPDGDEVLYAYVERGSVMDSRIEIPTDQKSAHYIFKLRFPPGATRDDQVLIDDCVCEGWSLDDPASP